MPIHSIFVKSTKSEFKYTLDKQISGCYGVFVSNIKIPISYYNINQDNNNFTITIDNNQAQNFNVTPGNYTTDKLIQKLNETLANVNQNPQFNFNDITGKVSLSVDANHTISIQGSLAQKVLGFTQNNTPNQNIEAKNLMNLLHRDLFLVCKNLSIDAEIGDEKQQGKRANILYHSNINVPGFSVFVDQVENPKMKEILKPQNVNNLDLLLMDENFEPVNLHGLEFSFRIYLLY